MKKKVLVGLSGGVDSSVSAALLKEAEYEATGVFIRVWQPDFFNCGWKDDRLDAMRICAKLEIPFRELNLENVYKKEVVDYMIREYKAGKTPNPDVMCNRYIKFGAFYKWARENGADFIATGHYARIKGKKLLAGSDTNKDQSYFLWQIKQEQLPHILFPVGGMLKSEVRMLAKEFGLITAEKKDSQGLCFVGKVNMKEFLSHYIKPRKGEVLNEKGQVIGEHNGAFLYTIGERLGDISENTYDRKYFLVGTKLYVIAKDVKKNTLMVSHKSPENTLPKSVKEVLIRNCNWISDAPEQGKIYQARVRYRQPLQKCRVANTYGRRYLLLFEEMQTVAPGQSLVIYEGDVCLGGGTIV